MKNGFLKKWRQKKQGGAKSAKGALSVFFALFLTGVFAPHAASVEMPEHFLQGVLPNGMTVFVYEDFSAPKVKIEYAAKAGFSCQSEKTAGFAPLYASLFSEAGMYSAKNPDQWLLKDLSAECLADSARYAIEASANQTEEIFRELAVSAFAPIFSDRSLSQKLQEAKDKAAKNAFSAEGFINAAIDSRVFSSAPWKHDSGIYPALFQRQSLSEARAALSEMAKNFYSPQNSCLFVVGAIKKEAALLLAQKTFGEFSPAAFQPKNETPEQSAGAQRKFVLSDPELSPDMAQAVFEWTSLSMEEADIAAAILNSSFSNAKTALTSKKMLNIRGSEYINAGAAHKNGSSRLIIQALLEKSEADYFSQSALFEKIIQETVFDFSIEEFEQAKNLLLLDFERRAGSPRGFMELLSQFWAVDGIAKNDYAQSGQAGDASSLAQRFLARSERILQEDCGELKFKLQNEEPFCFFLLNSKSCAPLSAAFENSGYEIVSSKNASWHSQEMFSKIKESLEAPGKAEEKKAPGLYDEEFVLRSKKSSRTQLLSNEIPVHTILREDGEGSAVCLYIKGGEALDAEKQPGLEAVTERLLCQNARKAALKKISLGLMKNSVFLECETGDTSGLVVLECLKGDEERALECLFEALVFSEIVPAEADRFLAGRKSEQIIKSSAMPRQLFSAGTRAFYKNGVCRALYSGAEDILKNVSYNEIVESYARLFDAARLEIIAAGNFNREEFAKTAEALFGNINSEWKDETAMGEARPTNKFSQRVKLKRTFLTDVSADKAGPRPAVLVPTSDFSDPAQYWFLEPEARSAAPLFRALLAELDFICKKIFSSRERYKKMTSRVEEKSALVCFGQITFFNVQYISDADAVLQEAIGILREEIAGEGGEGSGLEKIKERWIMAAFEGAEENSGSALLAAKKRDERRANGTAFDISEDFVKDYEAVALAGAEDFLAVLDSSFSRFWKFYSADTKR